MAWTERLRHEFRSESVPHVLLQDRRLLATLRGVNLRFANASLLRDLINVEAPGGNALQQASLATPNPEYLLRIAFDIGRYPGKIVRTYVRMPIRIRTARPNRSPDRLILRFLRSYSLTVVFGDIFF